MAFQWAYVAPRVPLTVARQYPSKTGGCSISGCKRTPTDWHHIISQAQIIRRGLPESMFTDPGNLQELCRYHHDMTTASMDRKRLTKKHGPLGKRKPRMTEAERNAAKKKAKEKKQKENNESNGRSASKLCQQAMKKLGENVSPVPSSFAIVVIGISPKLSDLILRPKIPKFAIGIETPKLFNCVSAI